MHDEPPTIERHVSIEDIERYQAGNVGSVESALIGRHLMVCQSCADRSLATQRFVERLRAGKIRNQKDEMHR